jgi:uncharacterized protein
MFGALQPPERRRSASRLDHLDDMGVRAKPSSGRQLIESYGGGGFRVAGVRHSGSVLVFPAETLIWPVADATAISVATLRPVVERADRARILVIGSGRSFSPRPTALDSELRAAGIQLEWMDTGAACRTYNVLTLEDRDVAAALIAVE